MVEEYLSDREQEEALFAWWRENWLWVISGVALGLAGLGGWQYWKQRAQEQSEAAAQTYADLSTALSGPPSTAGNDKAEALIRELDSKYAGTPYADQGHMLLAQHKVSANQFEQAAGELKIVAERSKDEVLAQVARMRLARVQLQLGHPDEALALLDVNKAGSFVGQVQELRGDALLAKGERSGARLAYQAALNERAGQEAPGGDELLRLKLQDLSDAELSAAAVGETLPSTAAANAPAPVAEAAAKPVAKPAE